MNSLKLSCIGGRPRNDVGKTVVHRAHLAALQRLLDPLHPANIANILESLPLKQPLGRDPALGSSATTIAITDSGGYLSPGSLLSF